MMRSMFSGVSGLRVHQTKMDVIANNISNVNTVGYKASRVTFNEVFSQNVGGASQANAETNRGGVNPMQIGLGASVFSIDKLMTTGAAQRTDNPFDIMIQGEGFFIVGDNAGTYFSRAGNLNIDEEGNLVNANGLRVMGWDAERDTTPGSKTVGQYIVQKGTVKPIAIMGEKNSVPPTATSNIKFEGNLNPDTTPVRQGTMDFYDSVGNRYVVDLQYKFDAAGAAYPLTAAGDKGNTLGDWSVSMGNLAYPNGDKTKDPVLVVVDAKGITLDKLPLDADSKPFVPELSFTGAAANATTTGITGGEIGKVKFDSDGNIVGIIQTQGAATPAVPTASPGDPTPKTFKLNIVAKDPLLLPTSKFGTNGDITLDFKALTQHANETANGKAVKVDGNKPGTLVGMNIGSDGKITGRYSNGELRLLAQIPIAKFANPAGLEKVGDNLFVTTANSGDFDGVGEEVQSGGGKMLGGVLEMSNVDLSSEFTEMITTQRGFQANSRVITTSDEMLQELVNLKR